MPQALYQKYRPQTWAEITDQRHVKVTLENEIVRSQIAHAYLFVGPRGVGKTTTARLFAKSVNCEKRSEGSGEPCNACASCERVSHGQSLDIIEMDAASNTGVDNVREHVIESVQVSAGHSKYRVYIIDEVHMLSTAAFNAMLKVLEEPPAHVIFILATTEIHKVPATIISRCQRFDFKRIPADDIRERLRGMATSEGVEVDEDVLTAIAERSDGSLRDAESTLGQILSLHEKHVTLDEASLVLPSSSAETVATLIDHCLAGRVGEAIELVNVFVEEGGSPSALLNDLISWVRTLLVLKASSRLDLFSAQTVGERREIMLKQSGAASMSDLTNMLDVFIARRKFFADSPIPQLPLELAVIEVATRGGERDVPVVQQPASSPTPKASKPVVAKETPNLETPAESPKEKPEKKKAPAAEKKPAEPVEDFDMSGTEIERHWEAFLEEVKKVNHSLSFVLASTKPIGVRGGRLELAVSYEFHRERLSETKNSQILNDAATTVIGRQIRVEPKLTVEPPA